MVETQNYEALDMKTTGNQVMHKDYKPNSAMIENDTESKEKRENELNLDIKMIDDSFSVGKAKITQKNARNESFGIYKNGEYLGDIHSTNGDGTTSKYAEEVKTSENDVGKDFITKKGLFVWLKDFYAQINVMPDARGEFTRMLHSIFPEDKNKMKTHTEELINSALASSDAIDIAVKTELIKDDLMPGCEIGTMESGKLAVDKFIEANKGKTASIKIIYPVFDGDFSSDLDGERKIYKIEKILVETK